jgi:serine/threonine protein kinase
VSQPVDATGARARALALFDDLVDAPRNERAAAVAALRGADPAAADYLERLLGADEVGSGLFGGAGADLLAGDDELTAAASYQPGQVIGPYRLLERLGSGGMGEVWAADRTGEGFAQSVALKLLPPAVAGPAGARFRRERRILAVLEHPGIARFIDGGISPDGVPFLAMERIAGLPITRHVDEQGAGVEERLRLFAEVCDVVAFAHRGLVVHRDLKPSNVLVTGDGKVKLLDFGIAKLLQDEGTTAGNGTGSADGTYLTRLDERVMTPAYAAPEQIRGERVTTATDVWALGVLLYELLTGERPFASADGSRSGLEQQVLTGEPVRPSSRLSGERTTGAARPRAGLARRLRGDLDAIVLTALEKAPDRRYASVDALATDVRAFLAGHPIAARPTGFAARALKFARRHRAAVGAAAVAVLAIAIGIGLALWQARAAAREGRRAEEVKAFLLRLFASASPEVSRGAQVTARELLDEGVRQVDEVADDPALQTELYLTIARLYGEIGLAGERYRLARRGLDVAVAELGEDAPEAFDARIAVAEAAIGHDALPEARREVALLQRLAARRGEDGDAAARATAAAAFLASEDGRADEAVRLQRDVVRHFETAGDSEHLLKEQASLAEYLFAVGEREEVEEMQRAVLAAEIARHGELHPATARARHNLGITLGRIDGHEEAVRELEQAVAVHRQVEGDSHPHLAESLHELAIEHTRVGDYDAAAAVVEEGLAVARRARGERSFLYGTQLNDRAVVAYHQGRYGDAARDFGVVAATWNELLGPDHPDVLTVRSSLAAVLERLGRLAEAEVASREVLAATRRNSPEPSWLSALNTLGIVLRQRGKATEAAELHREAFAIAARTDGAVSNAACWARLLAGRALLAAGETAAGASEVDASLPCALTFTRPDSAGMALFHLGIAEARLAEGKPAAALAALERSAAIRRHNDIAEGDPRFGELFVRQAEALHALGRRAEAGAALDKAASALSSVYPADHPLLRRIAELRGRLG